MRILLLSLIAFSTYADAQEQTRARTGRRKRPVPAETPGAQISPLPTPSPQNQNAYSDNIEDYVVIASAAEKTSCQAAQGCTNCGIRSLAEGCWTDALFVLTRPDRPNFLTIDFVCNTVWSNLLGTSDLARMFANSPNECTQKLTSLIPDNLREVSP